MQQAKEWEGGVSLAIKITQWSSMHTTGMYLLEVEIRMMIYQYITISHMQESDTGIITIFT